ncbi:MAG: hypothetical protein A2135_05485 [Actinobacteria bacterium RBG_16_67_15]|nr:MAG: hypothetical protein A2135_05485 [Actinobacteria bacterium RBG_16_67_15]
MVVALLLLAACGGGGAAVTSTVAVVTTVVPTATTEAGFEVTSEDGAVTVHVPASAMTEDPGITIRELAEEEYPGALGAVAADPATRVYDLGPDGTEFAAPVTVSIHIDATTLADLAPNEVPVFLLFTTADEGFEVYGDLSIMRRGSEVVVSGSVSHFSPVVLVRESTTAVVALDQEELESVASARSVASILELMTEAPGSIPVTAGFRDASGSSLPGRPTFLALDGVPGTPRGSLLEIDCDAIGEIEVLSMAASAVYGSDAVGGVIDFITARELLPETLALDVRLGLEARVRCTDPSTSVLGLDLTGFGVASDHPGGTVWIPGGDFRGGLSATYVWTGLSDRLADMYGGLICDNDGDGVVDATDTMFPAYALTEANARLELVAPLFSYASYFLYVIDGAQYSGLPPGAGWTVADGLLAFEELYTGTGRFEASIGIVGSKGSPFMYTVDASEAEQPVEDARLEYLDLFRAQIRF